MPDIRWNNVGVEPSESRKNVGRAPGELVPADEYNYYLNQHYLEITRNKVSREIKTDTGVADAYVVTTSADDTGLDFEIVQGNPLSFIATNNNTGACTITIDGQTALDIKVVDDAGVKQDPEADVIKSGQKIDGYIDSGFFVLAPKGAAGNLAWLQQYDGANSVLKTDKDKDVAVKTGEYVYNEFYETAVTPPNGDNSVKALLHMDGADGSTTFTDEVGTIWTANGNAQIDTAQSKFGGASALFDGTGDWIDREAGDDLDFGDKDFTIDYFFRRGASGITEYMCGQGSTSAETRTFAIAPQSDNTILSIIYYGALNKVLQTATTITDTDWHHLALDRYNDILTLFLDGNPEDTENLIGISINSSQNKFSIGRFGENTLQPYNGNIDEFRLVNGESKYKGNPFTPPTAPYDFVPSQIIPPTTKVTDTLKALLHMDGIDGSTTFTDETGVIWTANGNAQIDTAESKFGGASALFDGIGDWIDTDGDFIDLNQDFTIDFLVKKNLDGVSQYFCGQYLTNSTSSFRIGVLSTNELLAQVFYGSNSVNIQVSSLTVDGNFHHIALIRSNNTLNLHLDGVIVGTADLTGITVNKPSTKMAIGRPGEATQYFNGHVDEFRMVMGEAKWTTNFTPPIQAYIFEDETNPNNKATIDGTLEMYNPEIGQVYQGFVSKFNLWDAGMEGANSKSVQRATGNFIGTSVDISIASVNLNKSYPLLSMRTETTVNYGRHVRVEAVDSTTYRLFRNNSTGDVDYTLEIVEDPNCNVQYGQVNINAAVTDVSVTAVDLSKSFLVVYYSSSDTTTFPSEASLEWYILDENTIRFEPEPASNNQMQVTWYLVSNV